MWQSSVETRWPHFYDLISPLLSWEYKMFPHFEGVCLVLSTIFIPHWQYINTFCLSNSMQAYPYVTMWQSSVKTRWPHFYDLISPLLSWEYTMFPHFQGVCLVLSTIFTPHWQRKKCYLLHHMNTTTSCY